MKRRGGVMVLTLAVLTGLVAIVAMVASTQRLAFRAALNSLETDRAKIAAEAGLQLAFATLQTQSKTETNLLDDWANLGAQGDERFVLGATSFRIEIVDASSRINLNEVTQEQLERIGLTEEQVDSLLDWREEERTARPNGAKDEYYNQLPDPYNARLRDFDSVDELLLVRGFTPLDLFEPLQNAVQIQPDSEVDIYLSELLTAKSVSDDSTPDGQPKLNVNSQEATVQTLIQQAQISPALAAQIVQRRATVGAFTSIGQILELPGISSSDIANVLDRLSVGGSRRALGRININTVTEEALNTFEAITPDLAQAIVSRQSTGFAGLGELASLPGMTPQILGQVAIQFAVNSQVFVVRVVGESGPAQYATEVLVSIEGDSPKILRRSTSPEGYLLRWNWAEEPSTETVLMEAA